MSNSIKQNLKKDKFTDVPASYEFDFCSKFMTKEQFLKKVNN